MRVLVLKNGKLQEKEIKNSLEELQSIVGGYIEFPFLGNKFRDNTIDVIINEEGKFIEGLKPEIALVDGETKSILDIVYGNCIFASHDEEGNTIGLNDEQIKIIMEELQMNVLLSYKNNEKEFVAKALFL
jgi:hypothetical protein